MSYYEEKHCHKGRGNGGMSEQISYNDLLDVPDSGGLESVTTDSTLTGDGTSSDPLEVATPYTEPTLGSEITSFTGSSSSSQTTTVDLEGASTSISNLQYCAVEVSRGVSTLTTKLYIVPSAAGTETGTTAWPLICTLPSGGSVVLQLPFGRYRFYMDISGGGVSFSYYIKYKVVDSKIAY